MADVLVSKKSNRKVAHYSDCCVLPRIKKDNLVVVKSMEEALENGFHVCSCCSIVARQYRQEQLLIEKYCKANQLKYNYSEGVIYIISRHDCWRILAKNNSKSLLLYHKNTHIKCYQNGDPIIVNGYHCQLARKQTVMSCLRYIVQHDRFRDEHPCTEFTIKAEGSDKGETKADKKKLTKKRKKQKKRLHEKAEIIRVYALIDELHNVR